MTFTQKLECMGFISVNLSE